MRLTAAEKQEIIRLVEGSDLSVRRTLRELGIHRSTFYGWYSVPRRRRVSRFRLVTRIAMVPFLGGAVVLSVSRWTSMARR